MKKKVLSMGIVIGACLLTGCSSNPVNDEQVSVSSEVVQDSQTSFEDLFNANLEQFLEEEYSNINNPVSSTTVVEPEQDKTTIENSSESKTEVENNDEESLSLEEFKEKFKKGTSVTFNVEENDIVKESDDVGPYDIFVMSFSYEVKPDVGFVSPSGKLYFIDFRKSIEGGNGELSVSLNNGMGNVSLPGEVGEWTLYYNKNGNDEVVYSMVSDCNDEEEVVNEEDDELVVNLTNYTRDDVSDYNNLGNFMRIFQLEFPPGVSVFTNELHETLNETISDPINSVDGVTYAGYQLGNSNFTIILSITKGNNSDEVSKIADIAAQKAFEAWTSKFE